MSEIDAKRSPQTLQVQSISRAGGESNAANEKMRIAAVFRVPDFDAAYLKARRDAYKQAMARSQKNSGAAVSILFKVMADPGAPSAVEVRAVECALGHSAKAIELEDVEAGVAELRAGRR